MREVEARLIWICSCALSCGEESTPKEVRILISKTSEIKRNHCRAEKSLMKNSSHRNISEKKSTIPELIKKAKDHLYKV